MDRSSEPFGETTLVGLVEFHPPTELPDNLSNELAQKVLCIPRVGLPHFALVRAVGFGSTLRSDGGWDNFVTDVRWSYTSNELEALQVEGPIFDPVEKLLGWCATDALHVALHELLDELDTEELNHD